MSELYKYFFNAVVLKWYGIELYAFHAKYLNHNCKITKVFYMEQILFLKNKLYEIFMEAYFLKINCVFRGILYICYQ